MLSYLCVINNRADDLRLRRIINNPPRGLGAKTLEQAQRLAQAEGKPLYEVVSDPYSYGPLEKSAEKFLRFSALIEGLQQLLDDGMALPDFYEELMLRTGFLHTPSSADNRPLMLTDMRSPVALVQNLASQFREQAGSIVCREILKNPPSDPNPTPRTAEFYRQRPCTRLVILAAQILDEYIKEHPAEA